MRRLLPALLLPLCACVIDGVPLPDARDGDDQAEGPTVGEDAAALAGVYVTRITGATVVFGFPGTADPDALLVVTSGTVRAQTAIADDGSFNITLGGDLGSTLTVQIVRSGTVTESTSLITPVQAQTPRPDNVSEVGAPPDSTTTDERTEGLTRIDATHVRIVFAANSFVPNARVAIGDTDEGTTQSATAGADGSLDVVAIAESGHTLFLATVVDTVASAPYVILAP